MKLNSFSESHVEEAALAWLEAAGWTIHSGAEVGPGELRALRGSHHEVILTERLRLALLDLNPGVPTDALDEALRRLTQPDGADLLARNRSLHRYLVDGVPVEYRDPHGDLRGDRVRVFDFDHPERNDWRAINQFVVVGPKHRRRLDIVLFVNGLPLGLIELKNAADPNATVQQAFQQLRNYQGDLPSLFVPNAVLVPSDGLTARIGTLTAGWEWFKPWRTVHGQQLADPHMAELEVMIRGALAPERFLALVRDFVVFEDGSSDGGRLTKKLAGYHQFHAVLWAVEQTLRAATPRERSLGLVAEPPGYYGTDRPGGQTGDQRIGVVWHTQGAGKSLTMAFYAGRVMRDPRMGNPTLVVLTDRNDLDDQLFGTFCRCRDLLRDEPIQVTDRKHLRTLLQVASGGVIFTTVQKFLPDNKGDRHPELSDRRNVVVIADEAHRSQYGFVDGFARKVREALPNASFIGFTGTPVEQRDANTRAVFGEYISIYDIQRAVEDGATVPIYYEGRLAKLALDETQRPHLDPDFEELTEGEELEQKEKLKTKWAQLEAVVGAAQRLDLLAADLVQHFEARQEAISGKGMIVAMSRRIAVELYQRLVALRPAWADGTLQVVMTGSASDPAEWQPHLHTKAQREALAERFRKPADPFRLVIVRDMWLTGFDAPSLHTLYLDKPMSGHNLMQAIARVNRVFQDKPGGLVVDYLGLTHQLKEALATYTHEGGRGQAAVDQDEAVRVMREKHEVCTHLFHGFDFRAWADGSPAARLALLPTAQDHILGQENGKDRFGAAVRDLTRAFALAVPRPETHEVRDDLAFFQTVTAALHKAAPGEPRSADELDAAVRRLIARAVAPEGVVDLFAAAGLAKPDLSILSEDFLAEVRGMPYRNLAVELLQKLLRGELTTRRRKNAVQARSFTEMLEQTLRRYQNRGIEAAQVIEELIELARQMRAAAARGEQLGLSDDELAFYDALETNDSAVQVLGDETLRAIARELYTTVRNNVSIDWTRRESVQASLRVLVKRILRRHGYPPDKQEKATQTVLEQAALLLDEWEAA